MEVLDILLDENNGRRILIDVKHMSAIGRKQFYELRKIKYNNQIPVIISHGVCNGLPALGATVSNYPELGNCFISPIENVRGGDGEFKDYNLINFFDDEILEMVKSEGIIGIQLDAAATRRSTSRAAASPPARSECRTSASPDWKTF